MSKIGIFFGSDTGNTKNIAYKLYDHIGHHMAQVFDIANTKQIDMQNFNILLFGIPTWYYGELQYDWDNFLPILKKINFKNKYIGLFGCGDQEDYGEYFCDALSIIYKIIKKNKANIIGYWPNINYNFYKTNSLKNKDYFLGLVLDEDRQAELTDSRIKQWVQQIMKELKNII
ncbi:flavodoxin FldA [Enterobacteriaceae endosymbiont of Neohaemonia nigricornis]|uniref:flavodoxin FldA n=1 Tax=Enterobacteriaceae endosymbiont of Neohaemonia nigricornis TaxID=2675792 RepID=UPI00144A1D78|nr:flavodoxin FldA [Enterobacteriaceae endosymbiont of Neohaemonia nigricornis]QJC30490.1 flavodoxin FldA [Enterobacteriaceae endosymbiont of Neohaemonia nigricornis]